MIRLSALAEKEELITIPHPTMRTNRHQFSPNEPILSKAQPLLLEPWREQHPNGHEQTIVSFAEQEKPSRMLPLFKDKLSSSLEHRHSLPYRFRRSAVVVHNADAYLTYSVEFDAPFNVIRECVAERRQETVV